MPATNIHIRNATQDDIPNIQEIAFSTWPVAYSAILSKEQLHYMLDMFYSGASLRDQMKNGHTFLMAEYNGEVAGFAAYNQLAPSVFKLQKLYVLPMAQKTGAGKILLNEVIERIKKEGAQKLQLNVNRNNKAIGFYEKMGFIILKEDDINIGENYFMNDYVMEKKL